MTQHSTTQHSTTCAHLRSARSSDEWYTPVDLIRALGTFDLDPACGPLCKNRTAARRIGPDQDGLSCQWTGRVWLNPPFSNARAWIDRLTEHGNGIALVFCRSDAGWFQRAMRHTGCAFLFLGRTKFTRPEKPSGNCPLGCCLLPFGTRNRRAIERANFRGLWIHC